MNETFDLVRGPQDGAKITGMDIPEIVYVGRRWMGDGYAAWGREQSKRFPEGYRRKRGTATYHYLQQGVNWTRM